MYESGLNTYIAQEKFYRLSLDATRFTFVDNIINKKTNLLLLNSKNKTSLSHIDLIREKISSDQMNYFYPDSYEIKHLADDPYVQKGFNSVKDIVTPLNIYNFKKYGFLGSNIARDLDIEIFNNDIGFGDI